MKTTISILVCKIITFVCHLFGKSATVYPGSFVYKRNKKVLWNLNYPSTVVVVTGSSGKGSTINMAAHILKDANKKIVWNNKESNIDNAIVTTILNNTSVFSHRVNADIVLLEIDERHINGLFKPGTISHMILTNITRDQPSRNIHPDVIYDVIKNSIDDKMHLIINADDPILNRFKLHHNGKISTYGIAKNKYSLMTKPGYAIDAQYCPSCHTKLRYDTYHYGHLGIYECPKCNFKRGNIDFEASDIDLTKNTFKINGKDFVLNKNVFFAVYYTTAAYALCKLIEIDDEKIEYAINKDVMKPVRMNNNYSFMGRKVELLEPKNENALSYLQDLNYIENQSGIKTIIIGFESVSRRYSYNDLSWLWDINFEVLSDKEIDRLFLIGKYKYDIAVRLVYAGISEEKLVFIDDKDTLFKEVVNSKGNIYALVGEDVKAYINNLIKEASNEKEN